MMAQEDPRRQAAPAVSAGLCATCRHVRRIASDRGSLFYQCRLAAQDPRFPRYPALPVRECPGYERDEEPF
jgi:hypothetical protein